jgi:hypothetical protein
MVRHVWRMEAKVLAFSTSDLDEYEWSDSSSGRPVKSLQYPLCTDETQYWHSDEEKKNPDPSRNVTPIV